MVVARVWKKGGDFRLFRTQFPFPESRLPKNQLWLTKEITWKMPEVSLGVRWFSILRAQSCTAPLGAAQTLCPFRLSIHAVYITRLCFPAFSALPDQLARCRHVCVPGSLSDLPITRKPNSSAIKEVAMLKHSRTGYPWYQVPVRFSTQGKV